MDTLGGFGVSLEMNKTRLIPKEKKIEFLGMEIDRMKETVSYNEKSIS
jgi:hypothetical protein